MKEEESNKKELTDEEIYKLAIIGFLIAVIIVSLIGFINYIPYVFKP